MSRERLQKLLARAGVASRRGAEDLIRAGRVTVNGEPAVLGAKADPDRDAVKLDGKRLTFPEPSIYLLLNKPKGHITSRTDPQGRPTIFSLLPHRLRSKVVSVGRLDFDTEGLIILTDDGEFANRIAHPRHGCVKTYQVKVKGRPSPTAVARLRRGIVIDGRRTLPTKVRPLRRRMGGRESESNSWWHVELREGRTRQIREMFSRIGHPVQRLRRVAIAGVADSRLAKGAFRELTARELERLRDSTTRSPR